MKVIYDGDVVYHDCDLCFLPATSKPDDGAASLQAFCSYSCFVNGAYLKLVRLHLWFELFYYGVFLEMRNIMNFCCLDVSMKCDYAWLAMTYGLLKR